MNPFIRFTPEFPCRLVWLCLPLKRLWSGDMTNARVTEKMRAIKPELILLRNDTREVPFQELIDGEYRVVFQDADHRLYTKKALAKQAGY